MNTRVIRVQRGALVGFRSAAAERNLHQVTTAPTTKGQAMVEVIDDTWRTELASRENNGITVRLLWSRFTNLVTVTVADAANNDYFELVLDEYERALDVFHHPFAHAAARGLDFHMGRPELEVLPHAA